jgi:uncharacterized protein (DUF1330 family)
MSAYIIFNYDITDRSKIDELTELSLPVNKKYGATVLIGSPVKTLEGSAHSGMVVLEFINFEAAEKFYYSDENKELSVLRNKITKGWAAIVPGDSETQKLVDSGYFGS